VSDLTGKVALVTGSSRGIGAAIARFFAKHGAHVAVHGRDVAALSSVRSDIEREEGWRATVDGNLTATFLTIKSFLPGMKQRGAGSIIALSSAAARRRQHPGPDRLTSRL